MIIICYIFIIEKMKENVEPQNIKMGFVWKPKKYKIGLPEFEFQRAIEEKLRRNYTAEIIVIYVPVTLN
jgi:hypothetical protein